MLWPYALKTFAEQLNVRKVDGDRITPMEKFAGTPTEINIQNHHTWGCPVDVLGERLSGNISGLPKWQLLSCTVINIGHSQYHSGSVSLVLNP